MSPHEETELIAEAARRYPIGTRFKSSWDGKSSSTVTNNTFHWWNSTDICANQSGGLSVWTNGTWAEIISSPVVKQEIINNYEIY